MLDRTQAPEAARISRPEIPEFSKTKIGNDFSLHVVNQGTQPVVALEIVFPMGRWNEPRPGLTYYTAKMLTEGTSRLTSEHIAETFDFYGSFVEITPTLDAVSVKLYCLKKFFPKLVHLLFELLNEASFPEREYKTIQRIRIQQIRQQHAKNSAFAGLKFRELIFGSDHPYGQIMHPEEMQQIDIDEVSGFHKNLLSNPEFYLAGMIDEEVISAFEDASSRLSFATFSEKNYQINQTSKSIEIDRDSSQASIRQGHLTISRKHQDTHFFKIANVLFGGYFGSRLMKNIREEKGLTYGIHASISPLNKASYWHISTEVAKAKLEVARSEILKEIDKLQSKNPEEVELMMVTNYMKGKFLSSFDSPFNSLNMLKNLHSGDLDNQYYHDFLSALDQIRPEDIKAMAQKHIHVENLTTVSVI